VTIQTVSVFRPDRLPSLSRLPKELGREERFCEACGESTVHILYQVPKKVILFYVKDHPKSLHATCIRCARSTVLTGEERERTLSTMGE
jgi:ribosomal protein S27AE